MDLEARVLTLVDGRSFSFALVCAATGARPRAAHPHPAVRVLRDTDSVHALAAELRGARRVVIAGNGGIALGLGMAMLAGYSTGTPRPSAACAEAHPSASTAAAVWAQ